MAVRPSEELLSAIKEIIGDDTSDEALTLIEDISDTINNKNSDKEDWKKKYEENDTAWRQKYRERFFNPPAENEKYEEEIEEKSLTYDELFKEE